MTEKIKVWLITVRKKRKPPDGRVLSNEIAGEPDIERYNALKIADLF